MKKTILMLIVVFLTLSVFAQSVERLKKENGFQEFKFNSKPTDYKNIYYKKSVGSDKIYYLTEYQKKPFGLACTQIDLVFYKEKLYEIGIYYKDGGESYYNMLKAELEKMYGPSKEMIVKLGREIGFDYWEYEDFRLYIQYYKNGIVSVRYKIV